MLVIKQRALARHKYHLPGVGAAGYSCGVPQGGWAFQSENSIRNHLLANVCHLKYIKILKLYAYTYTHTESGDNLVGKTLTIQGGELEFQSQNQKARCGSACLLP